MIFLQIGNRDLDIGEIGVGAFLVEMPGQGLLARSRRADEQDGLCFFGQFFDPFLGLQDLFGFPDYFHVGGGDDVFKVIFSSAGLIRFTLGGLEPA